MTQHLTNYERAKLRADAIDKKIIDTLQEGKSFLVEAGAGAGKTYSLLKVVSWIQQNKNKILKANGQKIICITYTNAAVDVIKSRLNEESIITPSTIHSFAWACLSGFQSDLIALIKTLPSFSECMEFDDIQKISYDLGVRRFENGCLYLYHDDVIELFSQFLDNKKFRRLISSNYPIILIDEYQDSFKIVIDKFVKLYIETGTGPQFGFFGDSWQTIYSSNGACGHIHNNKLIEIKKESNFRSQQVIVNVLNKMRPDLPQVSAVNENDGRAIVVTTDDYDGKREQKRYYKDELPNSALKKCIDNVTCKIQQTTDNLKVLLLTHKLLSKQQNYEQLLTTLNYSFRDESDIHLQFFMNTVEPAYKALLDNDTSLLFDTLRTKRQPIETKRQKKDWNLLKDELTIARKGTIFDVLKCLTESELIPIPPKILGFFQKYAKDKNVMYTTSALLRQLYEIKYSEVIHAVNFFRPDSIFSTEHGVKGEEYDSVLFVIGRGWRDYDFDKILGQNAVEDADVVKNRNLFYVCCSRPKKQLVLLITVPTNGGFRQYLENLFGKDNIIPYKKFMNVTV